MKINKTHKKKTKMSIPDIINPSDAPAKFKNKNEGFFANDRRAFGISLSFVNT
jgi:hypothetical protein